MAVAVRAASGNGTGGGAVVVTKPTGVVDGDLLVAIQIADSDGTAAALTAPTGWTSAASITPTAMGPAKVWTKTAASEGTSYSFGGGATSASEVAILAFTAGTWNTTTPLASITWGGSTTSSTSHVAPSITGVAGGELVCAFASQGGALTRTAPSGMTERTDSSVSSWASLETTTLDLAAAGATGTKTATASASLSYASLSFLVSPAAGAPSFSGTTALTGSGTLSLSGAPKPTGALTLSGSGTLALSGVGATSSFTGTLTLAASGSLSLAGRAAVTGTLGLSGSGSLSLSGRPVHTGTLARTGSGTLTLFNGALGGSLSLSGSGTLTVAGAPGLTGQLALAGSGALTLTGTAGITAKLALGSELQLTLTGSGTWPTWVFTTPTMPVPYQLEGRLWATHDQGVTVFRVNGQWFTAGVPNADQIAAADRVYLGGRTHVLTQDLRDELRLAGFGRFLDPLAPDENVYPSDATFPSDLLFPQNSEFQ